MSSLTFNIVEHLMNTREHKCTRYHDSFWWSSTEA